MDSGVRHQCSSNHKLKPPHDGQHTVHEFLIIIYLNVTKIRQCTASIKVTSAL